MGVEGRTKGATFRVSGSAALLFAQREDPDGQLGDEPVYLAVRSDEHGRVMNYDHPDPVNLTLFLAQVMDTTTQVDSKDDGAVAAPIDCSTYRHFALDLKVVSDNSPTDIEFFAEFSLDGGAEFAHYAQGPFASLIESDASVTAEKHFVLTGDVAGDWFNLRVVSTGTDGTDTFTFTARVRFWR